MVEASIFSIFHESPKNHVLHLHLKASHVGIKIHPQNMFFHKLLLSQQLFQNKVFKTCFQSFFFCSKHWFRNIFVKTISPKHFFRNYCFRNDCFKTMFSKHVFMFETFFSKHFRRNQFPKTFVSKAIVSATTVSKQCFKTII